MFFDSLNLFPGWDALHALHVLRLSCGHQVELYHHHSQGFCGVHVAKDGDGVMRNDADPLWAWMLADCYSPDLELELASISSNHSNVWDRQLPNFPRNFGAESFQIHPIPSLFQSPKNLQPQPLHNNPRPMWVAWCWTSTPAMRWRRPTTTWRRASRGSPRPRASRESPCSPWSRWRAMRSSWAPGRSGGMGWEPGWEPREPKSSTRSRKEANIMRFQSWIL